MHTITVEISKSDDRLDSLGWEQVSARRRRTVIDEDDHAQMRALRALCQQMDQRVADDPARIGRTVNRCGVIYEFGAYHATDIARIMSQAGVNGWTADAIPDVPGALIRMSLA
ncbi:MULTISPECIES: hypothetical protein [Bifidobacterium]|uniref:hypothetical protein n=1 Tax=Bifidobacterium TaxID=1678 RepID=UPI0018DC2C06|nr:MULTISPECIES: hypothetical protein [Bifidobacterium]MBH9981099.1 hypothetical protein [Bifidobacterium asteroides]MBI0100365.1 hypothetical protein [Bifidobacterium sp. W8114]